VVACTVTDVTPTGFGIVGACCPAGTVASRLRFLICNGTLLEKACLRCLILHGVGSEYNGATGYLRS
jgi:hypothetical protein